MKKNKLTKILVYSVCSLVIAGVIFLAISYFGKEEEVQKNDLSQNTQKQEQVNRLKGSEDNNKVTKEQEQKTENTESLGKKTKQSETKDINRNKGEGVSNIPKVYEYKGKKLSHLEGVGTTGKIFGSQKEALDFGKKEVVRLTDGDKKPRQFAISKVMSEDGSLVGWTVDIFEDNNEEKIVSNLRTTIEEDKE